MRKAVLIDGHGLIHRAFHALPDLKTKDGRLINAVYGFSLILVNTIKELKPDYLAVSFDLAKPTFRHRAFKKYKAKRAKPTTELSKQIPLVKKVVRALNIPIFEAQGYEADDVIGTLANILIKKDPQLEVTIVTGDLDLLQLVKPRINVYTMRRGLTQMVTYNPEKVRERFHFAPRYLPDYKGLAGDQSDNIPGIRGIGKKTAQKLIVEYGSLENIFQALERKDPGLPSRSINLLRKGREDALASRDLALIRCDVPVKVDLNKMLLSNYDRQKVAKLFSELEFKSLIEKLPPATPQEGFFAQKTKKETRADYRLIKTESDLAELKRKIKSKGRVAIDIETDTLYGKLVGISFSLKKGQGFYLPLLKKFHLAEIKDILKNPSIEKIGHGLKYDYRILFREKAEFKGLAFDTLIAAHLLDPEKRNYKLDRLAFSEFGQEMIPIESLMGKDYAVTLDQVELTKLKDYSCEDADISYQLYRRFRPELKKRGLTKLFKEIELPLITVLAKMEELGIKIDQPYLEKLRDKVGSRIREIRKEIYSQAGKEFNINSSVQLREVLFGRLKISPRDIKRGKMGLSTAATELNKIRTRHSIVDSILNYRQLEKLHNTYLKPLAEKVDTNNRLHTNFNQTATATGRLSSSEPNLQNIPARSDIGREVRQVFVSQRGFRLVSFDYSQIELRVVAHLSKDRELVKAFNDGQDIHALTAAELNNIPIKRVTARQRREAKTINFGILYGMSPYGLAQALGRSPQYAAEYIKSYFDHFSGVKEYLAQAKREVARKGYTETLFGRRRYFNLQNSRFFQKQIERAAINTPIQGTAADLIKKAMVEIDRKMPEARLLLQVHDELLFELEPGKIKEKVKKIKKIMEEVVKFRVPLKVDVKSGQRWGSLKTIF